MAQARQLQGKIVMILDDDDDDAAAQIDKHGECISLYTSVSSSLKSMD